MRVAGSRGDAVVPNIALEAQADVLAVLEDVANAQRAHFYRAANGAGGQAGAFVDGDVADQVRVDITALLSTGIAAIHIQRLLRAVHRDRHPALALDATNVHIQPAAIAAVAHLHAGLALEHITHRHHAKTLHVFAGDIHRRTRRAVDLLFVEIFARHFLRRQLHDLLAQAQHIAAIGLALIVEAGAREHLGQAVLSVEFALQPLAFPARREQRTARHADPGFGTKARQHLVQRPGADAIRAFTGGQHQLTAQRLQAEKQQAERMTTQDTNGEIMQGS